MKIVILTANYGNGHNSVAQTLQKDLEKDHEVVVVNPQTEGGKLSNSITTIAEKLYNNVTSQYAANKFIYTTYSIMFKATHNISAVDSQMKLHGKKQVTDLIKKEKPDVLIAVFPYGIVVPKEYVNKTKVYSVITDYDFANMWYDKNIHGYFVATDDVKKALSKKGVDVSGIHTTGIPIKKEFFQINEAKKCKSILLTLGAKGMIEKKVLQNMEEVCVKNNAKLRIVCGKNEKLFNYINESEKNKLIKVYGFVDNMEQIIKKSDLIITKAGGISISEAIASETPLILNTTRSLAGQEEANIKFVIDRKIGIAVSEETIPSILDFVINNEENYLEMVKNIKVQKKRSYSKNIIDIITNLGDEYKLKKIKEINDNN